ncbi:hypothetical protein [Planococcus salinus]|uniref:Ferric oxidoreductase domain-containing protein n=1 Tax=Planococcus salinus TaxID=1848460 RepID=A0A3M8P7F7_9BACL|nr:hypothetical protein [Planococcus salinus]RNF39552.1 hypothetical protein EEX84_08745 [Planococcus salinus]
MLKILYRLNFRQAVLIVSILSLPLLFLLYRLGFDTYRAALWAGRIGAIYLMLAFILYLFLYAISHLPKSSGRQKLVTFTRIYIRFHSSLAAIGSLFIVWHLAFMLSQVSMTPTGIAGYVTVLALLPLLVTGYMRGRKSSGLRRRMHRYMAFLFIGAVLIHVFV